MLFRNYFTLFPFAVALRALSAMMALLIIGQTAKAALASPVNSLKTE